MRGHIFFLDLDPYISIIWILPSKISIYVICFRKPWLRVKSINFDFNAKLSNTDHKESNKLNPKSLAHIGSQKSVTELGVPKNELSRKLKSKI